MRKHLCFYTVVVFLACCFVLAACAGTEKSAGMVIENAGSVVKSGGDKLLIDPAATPIPEQRY